MFEELNNEELIEIDGGGLIKFLLGSGAAIGSLIGAMACSTYGVLTGDYTATEYCSDAYSKCVAWALSEGYYIW